ncbi:hypothetical protein [Dickeya zeae]|uniref:hypothetical protein n=1 Tax=Dickeya zeae TaxID=204042 RepID=UPI00039CF4E4|nr:hypothetical protein [Dickeya zeae]
MSEHISYKHDKIYRITDNLLERIEDIITKKNNLVENVTLDGPDEYGKKTIQYLMNVNINDLESIMSLTFTLNSTEILSIESSLNKTEDEVPKLHLKYYILDVINDILGSNQNKETEKYTIRTYSHYFNSHPIRQSYLVSPEFKTLIKPYILTSKQESLTEQIIMFDIEVDAINIDHARSLAYNHTANINAYLCVLLDVSFEMLNSEFRIFTIKKENSFELNRYRTGFIDYELNLIVKDNHYGLKNINNLDHVNSFQSGQWTTNFAYHNDDGILVYDNKMYIQDTVSDDKYLDTIFREHKIEKPRYDNNTKPPVVHLPKNAHYPSQEIFVPTCIRSYFREISSLPPQEKSFFTSFCRMYNTALNLARNNATTEISYKICAIETLAKTEGISFSDFMKKYSNLDFNKELSDYFYSVRSSHFHSGRFHFGEFNINLQRNIDFAFKERNMDYLTFNNYIRYAITKWIEKKLLKID